VATIYWFIVSKESSWSSLIEGIEEKRREETRRERREREERGEDQKDEEDERKQCVRQWLLKSC
jgi:hypothetical protein